MSSSLSSAMRIYKLCALLGTLIILLDIGLSWNRINAFENNVSDVFERIVLTQMQIDGLQQELVHLGNALGEQSDEEPADNKIDSADYSAYELERLRNEQANVQLFIQEKQLDMVDLNSQKKNIMNEVRVLFLMSLIFLVLGTLLAAFGYLAWYFKVELFEDRRKSPRN